MLLVRGVHVLLPVGGGADAHARLATEGPRQRAVDRRRDRHALRSLEDGAPLVRVDAEAQPLYGDLTTISPTIVSSNILFCLISCQRDDINFFV